MKNILLILFLWFNSSVIAAETHLVCDGEMRTFVTGIGAISPEVSPVTITFDDSKNSLQSELLFPTCDKSQDQINQCKCTFEKTDISCNGLSRNKNEPKNIWNFNFSLNRISGKLIGVRQFGNTGDLNKFSQNSSYNYICKISSIKI